MDRFNVMHHPLLPSHIESWTTALKTVSYAFPPSARLGLWLPEAEVVVTPERSLRRIMYLSNWLQARVPILVLLNERQRFPPFAPNAWRSYLSRFPPPSTQEANAMHGKATGPNSKKRNMAQSHKRQQEKDSAWQTLSGLLSRHQPFIIEQRPSAPSALHWRNNIYPIVRDGDDFIEPPQLTRIAREVAWELSEVAFRVELAELDLKLVPSMGRHDLCKREDLLQKVFPGSRYTMPDMPPPLKGLGASGVWDRLESLEALRELVSRWPKCPQNLLTPSQFVGQLRELDLEEFEQRLACFYCQAFFDMFGRAPALPRRFPI
jgi:hypothetical protein